MKVLVIGSGAREHALVRALARDSAVDAVVAAPGNPGMAKIADCRPVAGGGSDPSAVAALARELAVDLVIVGPEAPLVAGVADAVRETGIPVFGPSAQAAQLEGSKSFAKDVMAAAEVPTAMAHICDTVEQARDALEGLGAPHVVKDDGLAAGKGVVVTDDIDEALEHARACLAKPDGRVVIEEFLDGPEVSLFCISDGSHIVPLVPAQDFKRVGDADAGPNTGGMGAYTPLQWLPDGFVERIMERVARPVITEMTRRSTPFVGVLYIGLAVTTRGPQVVEFNVRFGDPEVQVVLERLQTPLGQLLLAAARGHLELAPTLRWSPDHVVNVVIASQGYPESPQTGQPINGLDAVEQVPGAFILHAGTTEADGELVTAGGRVLSVVAKGDSLAQARSRAYEAAALIDIPGSHYRTDIALKAEQGQASVPPEQSHPRRLRSVATD